MANVRLQGLMELLTVAYSFDPEHSLMGNMRNIDDAAWEQAPPGGDRTIGEIFLHAVCAKWAYGETAFRGGTRSWSDWLRDAPSDREGAIAWGREGHERLVESLRGLDDSVLDEMRPTHWGGEALAQQQIVVCIEHDLYHAGEINHARALIQGTDRWPGQ